MLVSPVRSSYSVRAYIRTRLAVCIALVTRQLLKACTWLSHQAQTVPRSDDRRRRVWGIPHWNAWSYGHQVPLQPTRTVLSILFLNRRERGSRDGSVGQGACYHTWPSKINTWDPHDGRRELSCHKLASDLHMCSVAHVRQVNKQRCKKKKMKRAWICALHHSLLPSSPA